MDSALSVIQESNFDAVINSVQGYYQPALKQVVKYLKAHGLLFNPEGVRAFLFDLGERSAPRTYNLALSAIKSAVRTQGEHETDMIRAFRTDRELKKFKCKKDLSNGAEKDKILSPVQVRALIEGSSPKIGAIVDVLWKTGLRVSELLSIERGRMKDRGQYYEYKIKGKTNSDNVQLPKRCIEKLLELFPGPKKYLIENGHRINRNSISNSIKHFALKILHKNATAHTLRHSAGTFLYERTKDIVKVSRFLRHASVDITAKTYIHNQKFTFDELRDLYEIEGKKTA